VGTVLVSKFATKTSGEASGESAWSSMALVLRTISGEVLIAVILT
jgi:hypothetical protein